MSIPPGLDREQLEELDKASLIEVILALQEQVAAQGVLLERLRNQVTKDSHNSSKPPSSDGLKKPRTRSLRQKGKRPTGGQPGHAGETLQAVVDPDHICVHPVASCPHCQYDLVTVEPVGHEKRQVFDVPPVRLEVTEHQAEIKQCPGCGAEVKASFPADVSQPTQYGARLKAQASYLNTYHFIPLARTVELLRDFYGAAPSEAVVLAATQQLAEKSQPSLAAIHHQLISADVVHFDESGLRVAGKLNWLHVASTPELTYYHVHGKRGQEGMAAGGILPAFAGRAVHDHWASYQQFETCQHAFCNAHHLRELTFIHEQYHQEWAAEMAQLLCTIQAEVAATPAPAMCLPSDRLAHYEAEYDKLIAKGLAANPPPDPPPPKTKGRPKQAPAKNLLDRLQAHKPGVLAFMYDFAVPFDNNLAERDVRMVKIKQKVSGAFRTQDGAQTFCAIRSYLSTVRKHGQNIIGAIYDAFLDRPFIPALEQAE